ncbi:DUF6249 domain-containing protein [Mucilaginibacter sp. HD30]
MENIFFCVIAVVFIICAFLAWYFIFTAKQNERMRMIEKGITPDLQPQKSAGGSYLLNIGIIIIGLSLGAIIIQILPFELVHGGIMPLPILGVSGGIAMLIANYLGKKNE